jgi:L-seryl-tRNA(Ser) seleniumtransferase
MPGARDVRRRLPAVEAVLQQPGLSEARAGLPRALLVEAVRAEIAAARKGLAGGAEPPDAASLATRAAARAGLESRPQLRRVLNATGIVLHTNLGRAPLARPAAAALADVAAGYSSLEYDLESGRRGRRGTGIERWLCRLTGAEAATVVNNGAGAILVTLSALAAGHGVVVSRGELVEIGGSFRVPDILEKSGARLIEVGTTNRTHLRDYQRAFEKHRDAGAILRVHPSNFRVTGFTARPALDELAALARRHKVPLVEDLGSGALVDFAAFGLEHEPTVRESLEAGADVVTCSGDKLLGGSQAGLVLGRKRWIDRIQRDPFARALRADKLALAALEATLPLYLDPARAAAEIPTLAMLRLGEPELRARAERLLERLKVALPGAVLGLARGLGEAGGGSLPGTQLRGWVVEVELPGITARVLEERVRRGDPPLVATLRGGKLRLDVRTLAEDELERVAAALASARRG